MQQPAENDEVVGIFSVVIEDGGALRAWNLEVVPVLETTMRAELCSSLIQQQCNSKLFASSSVR